MCVCVCVCVCVYVPGSWSTRNDKLTMLSHSLLIALERLIRTQQNAVTLRSRSTSCSSVITLPTLANSMYMDNAPMHYTCTWWETSPYSVFINIHVDYTCTREVFLELYCTARSKRGYSRHRRQHLSSARLDRSRFASPHR